MNALSVVIATKDRLERVAKCLEKIESQTKPPGEVIIIDGSETPLSKQALSTIKKSRVVYINRKSSMVEARNIGIRKAKGNVVLFLDDDAFIEKDYIKNLMEFYGSRPEAGGAEGSVTNERNRRLIERLSNFPSFPGRNDVMMMQRLHGCNMSFRKEVFKDFMFDENLAGYYNDDDEFCGRVSKRYKLFFVPSARLVHDQTQYGGARIDQYRNYNTLVFNQFYSLCNIRGKNLFDVIGYIFSQILMVSRAFVFVKKDRNMAVKGILRGYKRILRAVLSGNVAGQIRAL